METRGRKMLSFLNLPKYESTKGTCRSDREKAIVNKNLLLDQVQSQVELNKHANGILEAEDTHSKFPVTITESSDILFDKVQSQVELNNHTNGMLEADVSHLKTPVIITESSKVAVISPSIKEVPLIVVRPQFSASLTFNTEETEPVNSGTEEVESLSEPSEFVDSGSEYVPSDSEASNDSNIFKNIYSFEPPLSHAKKRPRESERKRLKNNNSKKQKKEEKSEATENNEENEVKEVVFEPSEKKDGKRIRNKKHACVFCSKLLQNMARHYERCHSGELEVARILAKAKNSKERRDEFGVLIRAGDFYHNIEVLAAKSGELILVRRPTPQEKLGLTYADYGPCPSCLGFLLKKHLWHHGKYKCNTSNNPAAEEPKHKNYTLNESSAILNGIMETNYGNDFVTNVVDKLRGDAIAFICKEDALIKRFGAFLYEKYSMTQAELIRQNMRQLARLVVELRTFGKGIKFLADALKPEHFDLVINATKKLCSTNIEIAKRPEFKIPSLALKIGYAIKKCIGLERGIAIRKGDLSRNKMLLSFEMLMELEWSVRISSNALATLQIRKLNSKVLLPIADDLVKLSKFLDKEISESMQKMSVDCNTSAWIRLATLVLARIVLFNKRRSGEAARMTLEQYSSRPLWDDVGNDAIKQSLTQFEQNLAKKLVLIEIIGKRGNKVPVILTPEMKESVDCLIKNRDAADILKENPFIFAASGGSFGYLRGHDAIRKWCEEAELERPDLISGTKLRKYVATVCQVFNLKENEMDWLARHLGHDIRVHREFYRLHENSVELAKVSRLLLAVETGNTGRFAGKSLEEITVDELPPLEEEPEMDRVDSADLIAEEEDQEQESASTSCTSKKKKNESLPSAKKNNGRRPWSTEEVKIVLGTCKVQIKNNILPGKSVCDELLEKHPSVFVNRKWTDIKYYIKNHLSKINKVTNKKI